MAGFRVDVFKGIRPRVSSRLLPPGEAQIAKNTRLGSGKLEPWNGVELTNEVIGPGRISIHRVRNGGTPYWLSSTNDVDYARGPVPNDALERTYFTGEGQPRMTTTALGADYRYLGIPAPTTAPTVDGEDLPADNITGTMTSGSMATNTLKADFVIEDNLPANLNGWFMGHSGGYDPVGTVRVFNMDFYVGQEIRVASVVDANTVTIESASDAPYLAKTTQQARASLGITHFRTDDTGTGRDGHFRFYVPNGVKVTLPSHNLKVGDIIRITAIPSTIALKLTQVPTGVATTAVLFGAESDNGAGTAGSNTWPPAPISVAADDFWIAGTRAYPFVDVWSDADGAPGTDMFTMLGNFSWELAERDGVDYSDIATDIESRVYVYTFVSDLGEEGPPSPASDVVTIPTAGSVVVGGFDAPPTDHRSITKIRIYRANTGSADTVFQFVAEIAAPFGNYTDGVADIDLGEVLQTESWEPPPEDMVGITALPNGGMAGFVGKTVCFAEPYYPHAWPPEYQIAVDHDVVGLGVVPNGVAILTTGPVYVASGDHPRAMSVRHFNDSQACSSKRSIASTADGVLYSSPDGLAFVGSSGFRLVTEAYVTKREWQASFEPTAIKGFWHDGKYVGFHSTGGFVFDPNDESVGLSTHGQVIEAGYLDAENDLLYVAGATIVLGEAPSVLMVVSGNMTGTGDIVKMDANQTFAACGPPSPAVWADIAYDAGHEHWVVVASSGSNRIRYTADEGTSWNNATVTGGGSQTWSGIAYSPILNRLVAVSSGGTGRIAYSDDGGVNWTAVTAYDAREFKIVKWDKYRSIFVAVTTTSALNIYTSADGATWTARTTPADPSVGGQLGITAEWIVMSANNNSPQPRSADGITWTTSPNHSGDKVRMAGNDDTIVAAGTTGKARTSDGGSTAWQSVAGIDFAYGAVGYSERLDKWFMFPSSDGSARYAQSSDPAAATWTTVAEGVFSGKNWARVGFGDGANTVGIWDADEANPFMLMWKSGRTVCEYPLNLGAARVIAGQYPVTLKLWNDRGTLVTTRAVTSSEVIRLPGGYLTSWFEVQVESTGEVHAVHLAETVEELLRG